MVCYFTSLFLCKNPGDSIPVFSTHPSPVTDNLLFFNQQKRGKNSPRENVPEARAHLEAAHIQSGQATQQATLPRLSMVNVLLI